MPKLDQTHTFGRLQRRLEELEQGVELAAKDFRAVLSDAQFQAQEKEGEEKQELRKNGRARTKEEEKELGWKSKREIRIEILKKALVEADANALTALEKKVYKKEVRQARIFLDAFFGARNQGKEFWSAWSWANNELTRAGLPRVDGQVVHRQSKRDREIFEQEQYLLALIRSKLSDEELEQIALAEEVDLAELKKKIRKTLANYDQK